MNKILIKIGLLLLIIFIHLFLKRHYFMDYNMNEHLEMGQNQEEQSPEEQSQEEQSQGKEEEEEEPIPSVTPGSNITPVSSTVSTVIETPREGRGSFREGEGDCKKCLDEIGDIKQNLVTMNKKIAFNHKWSKEVKGFSEKMAGPDDEGDENTN